MQLRILLSFLTICMVSVGFSQTLTVESTGQNGPTFTNITVSGNTWTLTGNASVSASAIVAALANGSLTITSNSSNITANINQAISASNVGNGLIIGNDDNTSNITISAAVSLAGPIQLYGGAIAINDNMSTSNASAILVKARTNINQASSVAVTTTGGSGGSVSYWADADDNSTGYVQLKSSASITTNGGAIRLGGGTSLTTDFAFGTTAELCSIIPNLYISGVHIQGGVQLSSGGGDISLRGQNATNASSNMAFGVSIGSNSGTNGAATVSIISGTGTIAIHGVATGSGTVNGQGATSWGPITLRSASTDANAISVIGDASSLSLGVGGCSLGINFSGLFEATALGGGITIDGRGGAAPTLAGANISGDVLAASGPITFIGQTTNNSSSIFFGSGITIGKKAGSYVLSSSSDVIFETNDITIAASQCNIDCSGQFTFKPKSNSFPTAFSWPISSYFALSSTVSGLTLGKEDNTSTINLTAATTINGPVNFYGGQININQNLNTGGLTNGDVLLKSKSNIVEASSKVITTAGGDVTLWSDSDNDGSGYIYIAGGSGSGISSSGGAIFLGGGANLTTGYARGSDDDDPSFQAGFVKFAGVHLRLGSVLQSGGGNITLRGQNSGLSTAGVHAGVMGFGTTLDAGSGKVAIYGKATGSGLANAQGISREGTDNWIIRSSNSAPDAIQLIGDASGCVNAGTSLGVNFIGTIESTGGGGVYLFGSASSGTVYDHGLDIRGNILANSGTITLKGVNNSSSDVSVFLGTQSGIALSTTLGSKAGTNVESSISPILIQGDNIDFNTAAPVNTTGALTIEPVNTSFANALSFPISNLTVANTIGGLTLGKSGNTSNVTIASATFVSGPIHLYGGTIALNAALTTTNASSGNISLNGTSLSGNANISLASNRMLTTNFSSAASYSGIISGNNSNFMQAGTGVFTLTGANTYSGSTTVAAGGLTLNRTGGGTLFSISDLTITGGAVIVNTNQVLKIVSLNSGTLTNNSGVNLTIELDYIGGGTLTNNGTIILNGPLVGGPMSNPPVNFPGVFTTVAAMNNLTIDNVLGVNLDKNMSVSGTLNLTAGTLNLTTNTLTVNGSLTRTSGQINASAGTLAFGNSSDLNLPSSLFIGNIKNLTKMNGAGTVTINDNIIVTNNMSTSASIGALIMAANKQLTVQGSLTNNGTFTLKDGATFIPGIAASSIQGMGTFTVEKALTGNNSTWNSTNSGRFWYMGVPMISVLRSSFGNYNETSNRLWSYSESTKSYTNITDNTPLSAGTGYVHRRSTDGTLTFSAAGPNGLYGSDLTLSGLTRTSGASVGFHLISNPYMAYLDWHAVTKTNVESTYYIRSNNAGNDISALITYNGSNQQLTNNSSLILTTAQMQYIAPMQAIWVRVGPNTGTGSLAMTRSMLSHQTGNPGLKSSTIFPTLARVNLVDGPRFDQLLVFMNQDMSNSVDEYDSEKMFVSGNPQIYTMAAGKKLVMNGLNSNKKKISVPLYLDLPSSKVYELQLSEYILEDGIILLEDKQEGTIQDFTIHDTYAFYANSGVLSNRFVLHFFMPDATITAQGPSNSWVEDETSYTEGGSVQITADSKGKVQISLDQPETDKVEGIVQATDANGRVVYSGVLEGQMTLLELNVPSGVYYLTVQRGNTIEKKKVFIQD
jgi:autotransporter-associated beta strand protein